nr:hypothetical protein [Rhizobium rhizogenes]
MEAAAKEANVLSRQKVRETRAALVDHFRQERFVHTTALFAPDPQDIVDLIKSGEVLDDDDSAEEADVDEPALDGEEALATPEDEADLPGSADDAPEAVDPDEEQNAYGIAAE